MGTSHYYTLLILGLFILSFICTTIFAQITMATSGQGTSQPITVDDSTNTGSPTLQDTNITQRKNYTKSDFTNRLSYKEIAQLRQDLSFSQNIPNISVDENRSI